MKCTKEASAAVDLSPTDVVIEARRINAGIPEGSGGTLSKQTTYYTLQPNDIVLPDVLGTHNNGGNLFYRSAVYQTAARLQVLCKDKEEVLPSYQTAAERLLWILRNDRKARIVRLCKNDQYMEYQTEKAVHLILEDLLRISKHHLHLETSKQQFVAGKKSRKKEHDVDTTTANLTTTTAASSTSTDSAASNQVTRSTNHPQQQQQQQQQQQPSDVVLPSTPVAPATTLLDSNPDLSTLSPQHQYALQLIQKLINAWHRQRNTAQHQSLSILINTVWADELLSAEETLEQSRVRWQLRQRYVAQAAGSRLQDITRRLLQHWKLPENSVVGLATPPPPPRAQQQQQPSKQATVRLPGNISKTNHQQPSRFSSKSVAHKAKRNSNNAKHLIKSSSSSSSSIHHSRRGNGISQKLPPQEQKQHSPLQPPSSPLFNTPSHHHHHCDYKTGPLSAEEKAQLWKGIFLHGVGNWSVIAQQCVPTRSRKQLGSFSGHKLKDMSLEQMRTFLLGSSNDTNTNNNSVAGPAAPGGGAVGSGSSE